MSGPMIAAITLAAISALSPVHGIQDHKPERLIRREPGSSSNGLDQPASSLLDLREQQMDKAERAEGAALAEEGQQQDMAETSNRMAMTESISAGASSLRTLAVGESTGSQEALRITTLARHRSSLDALMGADRARQLRVGVDPPPPGGDPQLNDHGKPSGGKLENNWYYQKDEMCWTPKYFNTSYEWNWEGDEQSFNKWAEATMKKDKRKQAKLPEVKEEDMEPGKCRECYGSIAEQKSTTPVVMYVTFRKERSFGAGFTTYEETKRLNVVRLCSPELGKYEITGHMEATYKCPDVEGVARKERACPPLFLAESKEGELVCINGWHCANPCASPSTDLPAFHASGPNQDGDTLFLERDGRPPADPTKPKTWVMDPDRAASLLEVGGGRSLGGAQGDMVFNRYANTCDTCPRAQRNVMDTKTGTIGSCLKDLYAYPTCPEGMARYAYKGSYNSYCRECGALEYKNSDGECVSCSGDVVINDESAEPNFYEQFFDTTTSPDAHKMFKNRDWDVMMGTRVYFNAKNLCCNVTIGGMAYCAARSLKNGGLGDNSGMADGYFCWNAMRLSSPNRHFYTTHAGNYESILPDGSLLYLTNITGSTDPEKHCPNGASMQINNLFQIGADEREVDYVTVEPNNFGGVEDENDQCHLNVTLHFKVQLRTACARKADAGNVCECGDWNHNNAASFQNPTEYKTCRSGHTCEPCGGADRTGICKVAQNGACVTSMGANGPPCADGLECVDDVCRAVGGGGGAALVDVDGAAPGGASTARAQQARKKVYGKNVISEAHAQELFRRGEHLQYAF